MIEIGQYVVPDYFTPQCVTFGDSLSVLGPSVAKWVLMGHESLETRYLSVSTEASVSFLTVSGGESKLPLTVNWANAVFMLATGAEARNFGGLIDDVSLRQMYASGAMVIQWQQ